MCKFYREITKATESLQARYGVVEALLDTDTAGYPQMRCTFATGATVIVNRLPRTTSTPAKFVAQNALKVARIANAQGRTTAGYGGGK
jgi:hypothetical protein